MQLHPAELLQHYGYLAVFVAGLFEGESMLMLGAYAVHRGYLAMLPLIGCGALAAFVTDQFYFQLARRNGAQLLAKRPQLAAHIAGVSDFVNRHPVATVFMMRFAWGFRIVLPATLGLGRMGLLRYLLLDLCASVLWAGVIALLGVQIAGWLHEAVAHLHRHEHLLIFSAVAVALSVATVRQWRSRR